MKALVTGGAGFIGAQLIKSWLASDPNVEIVNLDKLTYSGDLSRLSDVAKSRRLTFVRGDICDPKKVRKAMAGCSRVVHLAAESHVDRSLLDGSVFLDTNVRGTQVLLDEALRSGVDRFLQVSTDEVYGSRMSGYFNEKDALNPSSPYSVSKAAGDLLALSYHATHGLPVIVTRGANTYGPYQYPEKVIPLFVSNALSGEKLPLYGDGRQVRNWIHVEDHCLGILHALKKGEGGQIYNISSKTELENIDLTKRILNILGKRESMIQRVADRLGHDRRYAIDSSKLRKLGWKEKHPFEKAFTDTVLWYERNQSWWKAIKNKKKGFKDFYRKAYSVRLKG
jgi:dTDP-glucose 4,6-dehydratase